MPYFSGPNGIREVADPGDRLIQSFQDSRRKRLLSDYFANGQTDLGQLAKYDPEAAQQIQAQQKQQGLAKMFADLYAAPEAERPKGIAALLGADLETGQKAMKAFDPRFQQASAGGVQSTFINDKGERVAIMRDGSVQVLGNNAPNNQIIDTGNGFYGVNKGSLNAAPVQIGGGQQQAAPTMQAASGEMPFSIDPSLPPEVQAAIRANPQQWGEAQDGAQINVPQQLRKAPPAITPYQQAQLDAQGQRTQFAQQARDEATAARKAAEDAKKFQAQQATATRQASAASAASQLVTAIDSLTKSKGFASLGTAWGDVQIKTPMVRNDAKDADAQLKNVAGQVALTTMERLKALSAVGATGFGSLTAPELKLLENSLATLQSENISNAQLTTSLKTIRDSMEKITKWQPQGQAQAPSGSGGGGLSPQEQQELDALRARFGRK